jgi:hypothetical protein
VTELRVSELSAGDLIDVTRRFVVVSAKCEYGDLRVKDVEDGQVYRLFDSGSLKIESVPRNEPIDHWADGTPRSPGR